MMLHNEPNNLSKCTIQLSIKFAASCFKTYTFIIILSQMIIFLYSLLLMHLHCPGLPMIASMAQI